MSDLWYVKLADGDVHPVTLDQLDAAFQDGHIDENTMVLASGSTQWTKLGDLAGLDEAAPPAPAPVAAYTSPAPSYAPAASYAPPAPYVPAPSRAPAAYAQPVSYGAPATRSVQIAQDVPTPNSSLRPLSVDLSDVDENQFKKSSGKKWVFAVLGIAAVAGGVLVVGPRMGLKLFSPPSTVAAAAMPAPPPPQPAPAPDPAPAAAPPASSNAAADSPLTPRFSEQQREQLLAADKQRDTKAPTKGAAKGKGGGGSVGAGHVGGKAGKSQGFTTGGNKYDPLNSTL